VISKNPVINPPAQIIKLLKPVLESGSGVKQQLEDDDGAIMHPDAAPLPDFTTEHARIVLSKLPEAMGAPGSGSWYKVAAALHLQFDGAEEAYDVLDAWSQGLDGYDPDQNRKRWEAGFNHGKDTLTTMKNLVFEASKVGSLKVRKETMAKWGLSRPAASDFEEDVGGESAVLPDLGELEGLASIRNMLDTPAPPVDWLVENFIARQNVTILAGGSGTSKSYLTMQMCGRAAVGMEDYGGMKFTEGGFKTLYLAYEDTTQTMHMRVENIGRNLGEHIDIFEDGEYKDAFAKNFQLLTAEILDSGAWLLLRQTEKFKPAEVTELAGYLCDYVKKLGIDLLVFDTASEVHTGEENATGDMVALMRIFRQLATSANCGVLIIQHVQKDVWNKGIGEMNQSTVRGASAIVDKARNVVLLARLPVIDAKKYGLPADADTHDTYIVLKHVKANLGGYIPLSFFERTNRGLLLHRPDIVELDVEALQELELDEQEGKHAKTKIKIERDQQQIWDYVKECNDAGDHPNGQHIRAYAQNNFHMSDTRAKNVITMLEQENRLEKKPAKDNPKAFQWTAIG
jgi:KaiC/GvpD/RAD55 family RecA-like ATPase